MLYVVEIVIVFIIVLLFLLSTVNPTFDFPTGPRHFDDRGCLRNGDATQRLRTRSDIRGPPQIKQALRPREYGRQGGILWEFWCWGMMVLCGVDDEGWFALRA